MFQSGSFPEANASDRLMTYSKGDTALDLIGDRRGPACEGPHAFIVRSPPGSVNPAHFHSMDQFQVFVEGEPTLGRHAVRLGSIHYADGYTPYGPIAAQPAETYGYMTLRPLTSMDVHYAPQDIGLAKGRSGENIYGEASAPQERRPGLRQIFSRADGVQASEYVAGPGEVLPGPTGRGYCVVLDGEVRCLGAGYPFKSCFWIDGADAPELCAGPEGATVLLLRFRHAGQDPRAVSG